MRLLYILGHNDSLHYYNGVQAQDGFCEHTSNRKITTLVPSLCFFFFHFFFCSHLYFDLFCYHFLFFIQSWLLAAATNRWLQPLLLRATWSPDRQKNLQAVNELPSMPSVKGFYKLTEAFVRALLCSLTLSWSCHHPLPLQYTHTSHAPSCSSIFSLYLSASCSSSSVAGAALSGFRSEQHSLSCGSCLELAI